MRITGTDKPNEHTSLVPRASGHPKFCHKVGAISSWRLSFTF